MAADSETFMISLSERLRPIANKRFSDLSDPERVFILVWEIEAEVNNGGFNQFYFNSAGDRANQTAAALRKIGAEQMASIVDRANASFPGGPPADRFARQELLEKIDPDTDIFDELDQEFYDYPDDLSAMLHGFVIEHLSDIRGG
jgi:hypothetical protein